MSELASWMNGRVELDGLIGKPATLREAKADNQQEKQTIELTIGTAGSPDYLYKAYHLFGSYSEEDYYAAVDDLHWRWENGERTILSAELPCLVKGGAIG